MYIGVKYSELVEQRDAQELAFDLRLNEAGVPYIARPQFDADTGKLIGTFNEEISLAEARRFADALKKELEQIERFIADVEALYVPSAPAEAAPAEVSMAEAIPTV